MDPNLTESYWAADGAVDLVDTTVGDLLRHAADQVPDRVALVEVAPPGQPSLTGAGYTDRSWTYRELCTAATRCANWLLRRFERGERVTVWAPNTPEWMILQYGAAMAGLVLVTANPALRAAELGYVVAQSRSAGLFFVDRFRGTAMAEIAAEVSGSAESLRHAISFTGWVDELESASASPAALPSVSPADPAQIQYTSGTTGFPKGALLHHRGVVTNAKFVATRSEFPDGGTWVTAVPLFHTGGSAMSVLGCANSLGTYGLCQYFEPGLVLGALHDLRADLVVAVPTMLWGMLEHPDFAGFDLSSCAVVISGGAPVPADLVRRVEREFDARFMTVYGQTEVGAIATATCPEDSPEDKADTVGRPLWQVEVAIADPASGATVPVGHQGEIWLRGYQCMLEYFDLPAETAATVRPDGWLRTGDLGSLDSRGFLRISGRIKDLIIRGGENISPREIEEMLCSHQAIADAAVVGVPDDNWGEQVAAVLRLSNSDAPPGAEELRAYCRTRLAPHKTPQFWYVVTEFPLTGSGKVQKFRVRELITSGEITKLVEVRSGQRLAPPRAAYLT